jgi:hypothetical protein
MYRALPKPNKFLHNKWTEHEAERHRKNITEAHSAVDAKTPTQYHSWLSTKKSKKERLIEGKRDYPSYWLERFKHIEKENKMLLNKMTSIISQREKRNSVVLSKSLVLTFLRSPIISTNDEKVS